MRRRGGYILPTGKFTAPEPRKLKPGEVLNINGYELDGDILAEIIAPKTKKRLLWAFVKSADGTRIAPVAYDETKVIWLSEEDLDRRGE